MAQRILTGQTVLLDSGSTALEVARHLQARQLTVVTNDLLIGTVIAERQNAHLVVIGSELLPTVYTMWGPTSVQQLQNLRVNIAVFGADTVTADGIYNTSSYELEVKRTMRSIARRRSSSRTARSPAERRCSRSSSSTRSPRASPMTSWRRCTRHSSPCPASGPMSSRRHASMRGRHYRSRTRLPGASQQMVIRVVWRPWQHLVHRVVHHGS
jgi:hypothetical protein